jgi:hypothetical protein
MQLRGRSDAIRRYGQRGRKLGLDLVFFLAGQCKQSFDSAGRRAAGYVFTAFSVLLAGFHPSSRTQSITVASPIWSSFGAQVVRGGGWRMSEPNNGINYSDVAQSHVTVEILDHFDKRFSAAGSVYERESSDFSDQNGIYSGGYKEQYGGCASRGEETEEGQEAQAAKEQAA